MAVAFACLTAFVGSNVGIIISNFMRNIFLETGYRFYMDRSKVLATAPVSAASLPGLA
jgi:hypothetical protein